MNFAKAEFIKSAANRAGLSDGSERELIFAGRSNVGKSSLINMLLGRNDFARTGKTPGKTVCVNYFSVDGISFVDLPGYGYAKTGFDERNHWAKLIEAFFRIKTHPRLGILIADIRREPTDLDRTMAGYFEGMGVPYIVAANKCDKLNKTELKQQTELYLKEYEGRAEKIIICSAYNGTGKDELRAEIEAFAQK